MSEAATQLQTMPEIFGYIHHQHGPEALEYALQARLWAREDLSAAAKELKAVRLTEAADLVAKAAELAPYNDMICQCPYGSTLPLKRYRWEDLPGACEEKRSGVIPTW